MKTAIMILLLSGEFIIVVNAMKNLIKELHGKDTTVTRLDRFNDKYGKLCVFIGGCITLFMIYCC